MVIENQSFPGVTSEVEWLGLGLVEWLLKKQSLPGVNCEVEWLLKNQSLLHVPCEVEWLGLVEWLLKTNHSQA